MATIIGSTSSSNWTYKLEVYDISTNVEDISSVMRVDVYIGRASSRSYLGGTFSGHVSINWETSVQETKEISGTIPYPTYIDAGGWYHLGTRDFYVKHDDTGGKTIRVVSELNQTEFNPHYASADGWVELTNIAVKTIAPDISGIIGRSINISLSPNSTTFRHSIRVWFGNIDKWLQADGSLGDTEYIFPTSNTNPVFTLPKTFYSQFGTYQGEGMIRVYTYNNNTIIGQDEGLLTVSCSGELCSPKITKDSTAIDVNPITVALTKNPNNIVRGVSNVEVTPIIIPSDPEDTATTIVNKFVNDIAFTGDSIVLNGVTDLTYWVTATNSRGMPALRTAVSAKGKLIPYVPLSFNIVSLKRTEPTTGEVELEYNGNYFDGEFTDETLTSDSLYVGYELTYDTIVCSFPNNLWKTMGITTVQVPVLETDSYTLYYWSQGELEPTNSTNITARYAVILESKTSTDQLALYYATRYGADEPIIDVNSPDLIINTSFGIIDWINDSDTIVYPYIKKETTEDAIVNHLSLTWEYRAEGEETYTVGGTLKPTIDSEKNTYSGKVSLGKIFDYKKRYEFVFYYADKVIGNYKTQQVARGYPVFWWSEDSFHIIGDLYVNDNLVTQSESNVYSTEETVVGVWTNGKPIYRKVFVVGSLPNNTTTIISHGIENAEEYINKRAKWFDISDQNWKFDFRLDSFSIKIFFDIKEKALEIHALGTNWSTRTRDCTVVIEYTKTTD